MRRTQRLLALCASLCLCVTAVAGCGETKEAQSPVSTQASTQENGTGDESFVFSMPEGPEESEVYVEPIEGISDDFIRGMDASEVLVEENSGVKYYNYDGEEQDVFMTLAESGVNYIRLRIWNDPYDENGNGYGGGNNDLPTAIELGKRATKYGMKVCIDFHYSDFWADPKRQHAPKAWEGMEIEEKCDALAEFTTDSLTQLRDAGVDVGMVQVGNEINNGMAGEYFLPQVTKLLEAGCDAVRGISEDIQIVIHYTNITDNGQLDSLVSNLQNNEIDYDIIGLSYYPFWDGDNANMQKVARNIQDKYGKKVMIAETSYSYTTEEGDGTGNSFDGIDGAVDGYPATVQGQASMIRDICAAANEAGVLGVFYWGGIWIPVGEPDVDNSPIWEEFGSGWASSYAADYDPKDAGVSYGGCSWDNQAMFDFHGHPLASLNVFKYLKYGSTAPLAINAVPDVSVTCNVGGALELPEMVDVIYNDPSENKQAAVTWNETDIAAIDTGTGGLYDVNGTLEDGTTVVCHVEIRMDNLVPNASFEDADRSMWTVTYEGEDNPTDYQEKTDDAHSGDFAFHFWSADQDMEFAIEQEITGLAAGTYQLMAFAQGGDVENGEMELYAITSDGEQTAAFMVTTYDDWQNPTIPEIKITDGTIRIGVRIKCNAASWGTVDDFTLNRISD
ncbi:MAG: glycosyl hydrolase 53 family protein [Clostridium sp.]|nr:glycosyl hydrolase 53 family protein [Clostridium sp.]